MRIVLRLDHVVWGELEKLEGFESTPERQYYLKYATNNGEYNFFISPSPEAQVYMEFIGKRRSFGATGLFRIKRVKRIFGKDKLVLQINGKEFKARVTWYETSAKDKPFWVNCSDDEYRALQKLKAN